MFVAPIQPYASSHADYASRFAAEIAEYDAAYAAVAVATEALKAARAAEAQATADRTAGRKSAPTPEYTAAVVEEAKQAAAVATARSSAAHVALSKAVNGDAEFMARAALDHMREAVAALDSALDLATSFFGGIGRAGSIDHASQVVQLPAAHHAIGRRIADPGQRADAVALLRATVDSIKERVSQVDTAVPPKPVYVAPMSERMLHGHTDLSNGRGW